MKTEKELIEEIGNVLHAYEDAYAPGAWEEFVKKKKRSRGVVYIRIAAAAAVLLMLGYAAWLFVPSNKIDTTNNQTNIIKTEKPYIYPGKASEHRDSLITESAVALHNGVETNLENDKGYIVNNGFPNAKNVTGNISEGPSAQNTSTPVRVDVPFNGGAINSYIATNIGLPKKDSAAVAVQPSANNTDVPAFVKAEPRRYERGTQRLSYDSLANLFNKPKLPATGDKKSNNLSYALLVAPSVGNQKMNFGTGVEVAYNINKNLSVSSGIAYAYVNAGSNRNTPSFDATQNYSMQGYNSATVSAPSSGLSNTTKTTSTQTVQGVKLALSGLEIPLNFQYKTAGGFYLSAGISAMSVIGNDLSYNYINNRSVSMPSVNGLASTINVITEETTQKSSENLSGYIGFYTLSAGKKVSFGKGKLNFAPFIKIPFNRVSSESIQLIHGGVQLGIGF